MAQKFDARQTISRDVLANLLGINGTELDDLLRAINKEFNAPYRIAATSPTPDAKINFQASEVEAADLAAKNASPVSSQIPSFVASTIDFQSGATTGGSFNISFPNSTVGFFRRIGFSLDASGTIQCLFSAEAASLGALANAGTVFVKGALPIGWIDLEATAASPGRFKTAGSATNIIENKVGANNRVHRIIGGGGSGGSGTGSGVGDDINALTFKASFTDLFSDLPTDAVSAVDYSAGKTDSTTYDIVNSYHRLAYDATRTVTGTGVNMVLNIAPAFTIKAGDMLIVGSQARRIASLSSQTVFVIESAFTTDPAASACTLSQAVHTKDLNNFAADGLAISAAFSTNIAQILMTYEDTTAPNDTIFDANTVAVIGFSASSDGTTYSNTAIRPQNLNDTQLITDLPTASTNLYLRMYANKTTGSGSVNVLGYKVFLHRDAQYADGSLQNQAYCFTNGTGAEINCSAPVVTAGKTRIQTNFSFPVGVNSGTTNGALQVYLNGQKVPRFVDSTLTPDASYKEIDQRTIELDQDYSSLALSLEVIQTVAVVDASDTNTTGVSQLQETLNQGTQGFVNSASRLVATTTTGTPALGTFYSTISNRKTLPDLSANLNVRMGAERLMTQQLSPVQDESGPNGEQVWSVANDTLGQIRFVGAWSTIFTQTGFRPNTANVGDYVEITFYGTGLNLLTILSSSIDHRVSVDGAAEGANIVPSAASTVLTNRNYAPNLVLPIVANLALGIHTVKIRNNIADNLNVFGFEVLTEVTALQVNPGSSYLGGRKLTTIASQTVVHNTTFESGTLGTRGGHVVVYQKADGSIAKAVQPTDGAQANLTSANHQNEEIVRQYHFREFGANRTDDFSSTFSSSTRAFTLDDGTTTLTGNAAVITGGFGEQIRATGAGGFIQFTFVGTGLDLLTQQNDGNARVTSVNVNGASIGTISTAANEAPRIVKVVSGLPYGTHVVRFTQNTLDTVFTQAFIVYQPKKPSVPAGALELADYNIMATFSANATAGVQTISTGVLRKCGLREITYGGAGVWTLSGIDATLFIHGNVANSNSTSGNYAEYTFMGTGFDFRLEAASVISTTINALLNGVALTTTNFPTASFSTYGTGSGYNSATGVLDMNDAATTRATGFVCSGLPFDKYTIRLTTATAAQLNVNGIDVITPIHSHKANVYSDMQNTLPVGSNSISDNRKSSLISDNALQIKKYAQAFGLVASPTTTSTSMVPCPDMSVIVKTDTGKLRVTYSLSVGGSGANACQTRLYVDGQPYGKNLRTPGLSGGVDSTLSNTLVLEVGPGTHKVDLYWSSPGGSTITGAGGSGDGRTLTAEEA